MGRREMIRVGLDVGTTKVCAIVALVSPHPPEADEQVNGDSQDRVEILGLGISPSCGIKKGLVVDIEDTVDSIMRAVKEAQQASGIEINATSVGIAGAHIQGLYHAGRVVVKDREIAAQDIQQVLGVAGDVEIPRDHEVLHVLPRSFIVDDEVEVRNPLGMYGGRLRAEVYLVTAGVTSLQNLLKCVRRAGLDVMDVVLQPLASGEAVLTREERELGVAVVDIGGGTTDLAVFVDGGLIHTAILPLGGAQITRDVAHGFKTPLSEAEAVKIRYGCAHSASLMDETEIVVSGFGNQPVRKVSRQALIRFIEERTEEIFGLVAQEIRRSRAARMLASGVVITGGSASMEGMLEQAEGVLDLPARLGTARGVGGAEEARTNPAYATGVGLILYPLRHHEVWRTGRSRNGRVLRRALNRAWQWCGRFL